jgi:hypothetical protein
MDEHENFELEDAEFLDLGIVSEETKGALVSGSEGASPSQ